MPMPARTHRGAALLAHRSPPDIFEAKTKAGARKKRDRAIPDPAEFDAAPHLCIELRFGRKTTRQVRRNGQWENLCILPDREE